MVSSAATIDGIFNARRVAIVGASSKKGNLAARIVRNLVELDFNGEVYPVGRSDDRLYDRQVYRSVLDVPGAVDLAVIAVPALQVPGVLEECGKKGVPYATITSSGFGEFSDERRDLDERLLAIAQAYRLRFLGPNCQGIRDFATGLSTRFGKQERQTAVNCSIGVIVQSGTISSTFERFLKTENIGLTRLASIGNKLNVDETDLLPSYLAHEPTKMVFLYLEGIRNGRKLFQTTRNAAKPIVLLKGNISSTTATIARSHSASVLNEQRVLEAAAKQAGITLVTQFTECQIAAKAFLLPPMKGRNLVIFGGSGGMAVVGADWAHRAQFDLIKLPEATAQSIERQLPGGYIKVGNPVDLGDFFDMSATLTMIDETLALPSVDGMVICTFDPTPGDQFHNLPKQSFAKEVKDIMLRHDKPVALVYAAERETIQKAGAEADMPIFAGADEAVRGLEISREHWRRRQRRGETAETVPLNTRAVRAILDGACNDKRNALTYTEAFELLEAAGIAVEKPRLARSAEDAASIARSLREPACMKLLLADSAHKTEAGGVKLNLQGDDSVRAAFTAFRDAHPAGQISLQAMVSGTELMLGAKRDPHFGPVVSVGLGGTLVELLDDAALRLAPISRAEAAEMIQETRAAKLLAGFRGGPVGDAEAVIDALVRLATLMSDHPEIVEIDVNPVMVLPKGQGLCVVDARVFVTSTGA